MATSWTEKTKNSTSFTYESKSDAGVTISQGSPIGLLLALTYASEQTGAASTSWDYVSVSD